MGGLPSARRRAEGQEPQLPADCYETWHGDAQARLEMRPEGIIHPNAAVTASGPLVAWRHAIEGFEAAAGRQLHVRLAVEFP